MCFLKSVKNIKKMSINAIMIEYVLQRGHLELNDLGIFDNAFSILQFQFYNVKSCMRFLFLHRNI